ncbi:MAG: hypothetical protein Ct9H300mP28_08340 [Pseudomonadota bacterium]|nr:MAG: hypothetical protein Ct9H300mP28_08340 [Pseudomonadota bacterium]
MEGEPGSCHSFWTKRSFSTILTLWDRAITCSSLRFRREREPFKHTLPRLALKQRLLILANRGNFAKPYVLKPVCVLVKLSESRTGNFRRSFIAEIAHAAGIPLMIDATFNTPYLANLWNGSDLVSHSVTKWMGGHGVALGGIVVEGGRFDWEKDGKFPTLTEPMMVIMELIFTKNLDRRLFPCACDQRQCVTLVRP